MIKDRAYWEAWELRGPLREPPDFEHALQLMDDFREYARSMGVFPPSNPLEGIEHKIEWVRKLHAGPPPGTNRDRP